MLTRGSPGWSHPAASGHTGCHAGRTVRADPPLARCSYLMHCSADLNP
jgi:hypothetical protein